MSSDRIQVLDQPQALPGKCVICGYTGGSGKDGRKFIDILFDLDFYGAVIFCDRCLTNAVNKLGYISPDQAEKLTTDNEQLVEELQRVSSENVNLRNALDALSFLSSKSANTGLGIDEPAKTKRSSDSGSSKSSNKRGSESVSDYVKDDILGI